MKNMYIVASSIVFIATLESLIILHKKICKKIAKHKHKIAKKKCQKYYKLVTFLNFQVCTYKS